MMRIVAPFGFYGWGNIGDEATLNGFSRLLAMSNTRARVSLGSRNPSHTAQVEPDFRYFIPAGRDPRRWWAKLWASAHAVVGGTPIMDVLGDWPLSELTPLVRSIDRWQVPLAFIGVGVENLRFDRSRRIMANEIAPRVRCWSVRSDRDRQRLLEYGVQADTITVAADMAWLIEPVTKDFGVAQLQRWGIDPEKPLVGVNLVNENSVFEQRPQFVKHLAEALDKLVESLGVQVVFLSNEVRTDSCFDKASAQSLMSCMRNSAAAFVAPNIYHSPREMMSIIACCRATISMRYHFCLFSAIQGVPFFAIERADKVADLCWDLQWVHRTPPEQLDGDMIDSIKEMINLPAERNSTELNRRVAGMRERAQRNLIALQALREGQRGFHEKVRLGRRPFETKPLRGAAQPGGETPSRELSEDMGKRKWYYLSEMAVSDSHGGGLTIQRILGNDLLEFDRFIQFTDFAERVAPIVDRLAGRKVTLNDHCKIWTSGIRWRLDKGMERLNVRIFDQWSKDQWIRKMAVHIVDHFTPENCIWLVVPQNIFAVRVMNEVQRRKPVRYVTWVMDDHIVRWKGRWHYPKRFESEFRFHLCRAEKVFVISPTMGQLYRDRFGVDSEVLYGPADVAEPPVIQSPTPDREVRLAYFGSIWDWQHDALKRLVDHLDKIDAILDLYVFREPPAELMSPRVVLRSPVRGEEVLSRTREYDGVVIPAGFGDNLRHLTELNISTKLSECYASGTVPVIVAPAYAAMSRFAKEQGGALVISDFDDPAQIDALRKLKVSEMRAQILREAHRVADAHCSLAVMRRRWTQAWSHEVEAAASSAQYTL